jgi:acetate CoA/acetoacetate CoA-transferase alpha subunit
MKKVAKVAEVVGMIPDGARIMVGGFMAVGTPPRLIDEIVRQGRRDLTIIANDTARPGCGLGKLISAGLVSRVIASHIGLNPETQRGMLTGDIEVELVPQGRWSSASAPAATGWAAC